MTGKWSKYVPLKIRWSPRFTSHLGKQSLLVGIGWVDLSGDTKVHPSPDDVYKAFHPRGFEGSPKRHVDWSVDIWHISLQNVKSKLVMVVATEPHFEISRNSFFIILRSLWNIVPRWFHLSQTSHHKYLLFSYIEISRDNEKHTENPLGPIQMEHLSCQTCQVKVASAPRWSPPLAALPFSGAGG